MKKLLYLLSFTFVLGNFGILSAQQSEYELPVNYKKRHAIYDYSEKELNNTDSVPDFASKQQPLKITGTVFLNGGVIPAKDVILFITQPDENGAYELKTRFKKRYVYHRAWVKTDADGKYTFYTFVPGHDRYSITAKSIQLYIKEPNEMERLSDDFLFEDDPLLTLSCRKKLEVNGIDSILKLVKTDSMFVATRDIVLKDQSAGYIAK